MSRPLTSLTGLVLVLALAACGAPGASAPGSGAPSASPSAPAAVDPGALSATGWRLVAVDDTAVPPEPSRSLTIAADGTLSGEGGCNRFNGSAEIGVGTLSVGPVMSTKMACADAAAQELEDRYLAALGTAVAWTFGDTGELVIEGPDGRLTFLAG